MTVARLSVEMPYSEFIEWVALQGIKVEENKKMHLELEAKRGLVTVKNRPRR